MEDLLAVVTYSKDGHKKGRNRKWIDGSLKINLATRTCQLFDDDGKYVSSGKLPDGVHPGRNNEEFELEKHLLVLIDSISFSSDAHNEDETPESSQRPQLSLHPKFKKILPSSRAIAPLQASVHTTNHNNTRNSIHPQYVPVTNMPRERSTAEILSLLHMTPSALAQPSASSHHHPPAIQEFQHTAIVPPRMHQENTYTRVVDSHDQRSIQQRSWQQFSAHSMHSVKGTLAPPPPPRSSIPQLRSSIATSPSPPSNTPGMIYFPNEKESTTPQRRITIPTSFSSLEQYQKVWDASLSEEITLKICETAKDFYKIRDSENVHNTLKHAMHGKGAGAALESTMRRAKVDYYGACELFVWKNYPASNSKNTHGNKKRKMPSRSNEDEDNNDHDEAVQNKPENIYLVLRSGRAKSTEYHQGDVWIISNDPMFRSGFDPGQLGDTTRAPWTSVVKSLWHGPNQDGKFEIGFLSPRPSCLRRSQQIFAIKSHEASMELSLLNSLRSTALHTLPILKYLLSASTPFPQRDGHDGAATHAASSDHTPCDISQKETLNPKPPAATNAVDDMKEIYASPTQLCDHLISSLELNEEQAAVIKHVASWAQQQQQQENISLAVHPPPTQQRQHSTVSPVCLIHGPFGTGKSSLLVALLRFFLLVRQHFPSCPLAASRILVTAHTNVAVDRVLLSLLQSGTHNFLRVGALRRIDKRLLSHSLHASESKAHASATAELKEMLKEAAGNPFEEAVLRAELAAAERGSDRHKKKLLKTCPIVGVTCCSSILTVLDDLQFDIVILDEASQMIEPLSLAPMLRAKCKYLVAAGDPLQLPPVIAHPSTVVTSSPPRDPANNNNNNVNNHGLVRPLFVRLAALGNEPYLLRRQYRCHPHISAVPNAFFYANKLIDACSHADRPSLLPGAPAVIFVDVRGQEERSGRSVHNAREAAAVVDALEHVIVRAGVPPGRCGVICFYRAQVDAVKGLLARQPWTFSAAYRPPPRATVKLDEIHGDPVDGVDGGGGVEKDEQDNEDNDGGGGGDPLCKERNATLENGHDVDSHPGSVVQVATVDAFQGAEKDVIILTTSTTRSSQFASDGCRLNVALTRAKHNLIVVGCAPALQRGSPAFGALIKMAKSKPMGYHVNGSSVNVTR